MVNEADVKLFAEKCKKIFEQVGRDIIGQEDIVQLTVIAMISGGNYCDFSRNVVTRPQQSSRKSTCNFMC